MIIQFNADKNLHISEAYAQKMKDILIKELTGLPIFNRIEIHLTDENSSRKKKMTKDAHWRPNLN